MDRYAEGMVGKSPRARFGAGTLALIVVLLLSACSGDTTRGDFASTFGRDDAVAEFELSTADNMPFTAGVSADVTAHDGASRDELLALVRRLSAFASEHPDSPVVITLTADGTTVPVFRDADLSAEVISSALDLAADERVASVELTSSTEEDVVTGVSVGLAAADARGIAFELARDASAVVSGPPLHVTIRGGDGSMWVQGAAGSWIDDAERAWTVMSGAVPAVGFRAEPGKLEVKLAQEGDVPAAVAASDGVAGDLIITLTSPLVSLGKDATGDSARALLAALGETRAAGIRTLWTDDDRAEFFVADQKTAVAVAEAISSLPESSQFSTLGIVVGSPDSATLSVRTSPSQLGDRVTKAGDVLADAGAQSLAVTPRDVALTMPAGASDAELQGHLPALLQLAEPGARVCATSVDGPTICDEQ